MAAVDDEALLDEIDAAMETVAVGGQVVTIRGKSIVRPKLSELQEFRDIVASRINRSLSKSTYIRRRRS